MLLIVAKRELRELFREPYTLCVIGVFVAVFAVSCVAFRATWFQQFSAQASLQNQAREDWLSQETDSPHQATHNGFSVYKLPSPLASIDPGVSLELGTFVRLESHQRWDATDSKRENHVRLLQLDYVTPALLMQVVLPLVVIALSHGMISRERERGTWGLLVSLGISPLTLILGKLIALFVLTVLVSTPVLLALVLAAIGDSSEMAVSCQEICVRAAVVYLVSLLYLAGWCAAGTALSARCSSGTALIILLTCWAIVTLVIPRLAVDLAYSQFPLPNRQDVIEARETAIRLGSDGDVSLEKFNAELEERLLKKYSVDELDDLPINLDAARLLAMEDFTNAIDDQARLEHTEIYQQQNRFLKWFEFLSPYLATRAASSSFAGTDQYHHSAFVESTEMYRRELVKTMNTAEMNGEGPGKTQDSARKFWSKVPEFRQGLPPLTAVFSSIGLPVSSLLVWCSLMFVIAVYCARG